MVSCPISSRSTHAWCRRLIAITALLLASAFVCDRAASAQQRFVIADQDASGPGGSDMAALLVLLQSPNVNLLGITVVTGDSWRDVEVAHTLRLLELMGRTDIKVYPGAAFPLVRTEERTRLAQQLYGKVSYMGAWSAGNKQAWDEVPPLPEGNPTTKPAEEDAAHFMIRMAHQYPHQVTIYGAGPLTNIALAIRLDPHFPELARELVIMGGSINPQTEDHEWANTPRREFNFWFDPEAASIVLHAPWKRITTTTIDASIQTRLGPVLEAMRQSKSIAARYLIQYASHDGVSDYAWDELAAASWLDPAVTRRERYVFMDVNLDHAQSYGDVLTWSDEDKPDLTLQKVHAQIDVDVPRLQKDLIDLFTSATPNSHNPAPFPAPPAK
jgi:purine nucleosidase